MKELQDEDIVRIMREEWDARLDRLVSSLHEDREPNIDLDPDSDGKKDNILSSGLKVIHKKSRIRYTIDSVGPRDVILLTPEGEKFILDNDEFEQQYALD